MTALTIPWSEHMCHKICINYALSDLWGFQLRNNPLKWIKHIGTYYLHNCVHILRH